MRVGNDHNISVIFLMLFPPPPPHLPVEWFPWCGLLLNVNTLDVRVDYSRYTQGGMSWPLVSPLWHQN